MTFVDAFFRLKISDIELFNVTTSILLCISELQKVIFNAFFANFSEACFSRRTHLKARTQL